MSDSDGDSDDEIDLKDHDMDGLMPEDVAAVSLARITTRALFCWVGGWRGRRTEIFARVGAKATLALGSCSGSTARGALGIGGGAISIDSGGMFSCLLLLRPQPSSDS